MTRKVLLSLLLIFFVAVVLRFYNLGKYPVGFHIDEASLGYNGYSFLKTGKDENNNRFPLYIDMFGDNRPSGYHYLTIVPISIFGLTEFATRFPGALIGSLTVFAIFFLVITLYESTALALLSALLIAISPWHITISRASSETIVALFLILIGFACVIKSIIKKNTRLLLPGAISLAASFLFYHTPRIFVPLLSFALIVFLWNKWKDSAIKYRRLLVGTFFGLCIVSFLLIFVIKGGTGRFSQVNIFGSPQTKLILEEQIRESGTQMVPPVVTRIFHNKIVNYALTYATNYLEYFTGEFLFIKGGLPPWYIVPQMGLLYLVELPFILLGILYLVFYKKREGKIPLLWLILGPTTAAITMDDIPNLQRALVMLPMFEILAAYGIYIFVGRYPKVRNLLLAGIAILFIYNFSYFQYEYFIQAKAHQTWYRFNGFDTMVKRVTEIEDSYSTIVVTKDAGGIYPHFLFYTKFDPATYQALGSPKDRDYKGFGKYIFVPQACPSYDRDDRFPTGTKIVYIDKGTCNVRETHRYEIIYREDGTRAFIIEYPERTMPKESETSL